MRGVRIDQLLVRRGHFPSREKARRSIMAGLIVVDGQRVEKAGASVREDAAIDVRGKQEPFVSRAGRKLDDALDRFQVDPTDRVCFDIGASTGGFTECLLSRGAKRVFAVDVGYNQLDYKLRIDDRVVVMERVNARYLTPDQIEERASLCVIDVSFISILKIVPALIPLLDANAELVPLIKPQFEAGRHAVGKGGIVRDETVRRQVVADRVEAVGAMGFDTLGVIDSAVPGMGGNVEAFAHFRLADPPPVSATTDAS